MAARMGYGDFGKGKEYYPKEPTIDSAQWNALTNYVLNLAPESVPNDPTRKGRNGKLLQFEASLEILDNPKLAGAIVNVSYDSLSKKVFMGNVYGSVVDWKKKSSITKSIYSPVISTVMASDTLYLTEIGIMKPSETARGAVYSMTADSLTPIYKELHRPVYTEINDLNKDGKNEIIICEFGDFTGELSLLVKKGQNYEKKTLLALPGSIKLEVMDMNGDGKKDIVALFSQGREGIYIFYQKDNLEFDMEQVVSLGPEYGSSWFSLLDFDKDGDLDLVLVNGDNADYSYFLKPYHGLRLYINEGENSFTEKWFYPINGATRVLADDFDGDGDMDFAVSAFFPDFKNSPDEGFVYLENRGSETYSFISHTTPQAAKGNWLVMEKGDFDNDGDIDLMLGNFNLLTADKIKAETKYDLLYLKNKGY